MSVCCECCQVKVSEPSSRGVLPTVVRRYVRSRNLVNEEAMTDWGGGGGGAKQKIFPYNSQQISSKQISSEMKRLEIHKVRMAKNIIRPFHSVGRTI